MERFQNTVKLILLISVSFLLSNCGPSSRLYKPEAWEEPLLKESTKEYMPSDVIKNPEKYKGEFIHWIGIVDTFYLQEKDNEVITDLVFDQKYYDYIEDFSIQQETMFISPFGEGKFILRKTMTKTAADSVKEFLNYLVQDKSLGFCYGNFVELKESLPILESKGVRFIPEAYYATNIFSYEVERDSLGNVVIGEDGFPSLTNFKMLKLAGPGKND